MAYQPVVDVAQMQCIGTVDGQITINDLYFQISGGGITPVNLDAITGAVATWFTGFLAPLLSDDWSAQRVVGTDLTTAVGPRVDVGAAAPGGVAGEANPNNVAACVSFRTGSRGRSGRGRNYVPGVPGSVVTLNTMDSAFMVDLINAYQQLMGAGTFLPGWQWVVVSRVTGGVPRAAGLALPVTGVVMVGDSVRSMRSREIGHGA